MGWCVMCEIASHALVYEAVTSKTFVDLAAASVSARHVIYEEISPPYRLLCLGSYVVMIAGVVDAVSEHSTDHAAWPVVQLQQY